MAATEGRPLFIRLTLPDGLEEALEGLAREVLRTQPENIYEFAANHFDQILKKRGSAKAAAEKELEAAEKVDGVDEDDGTEVENIEERIATPEDTQVRSRPTSSKKKHSIDIQMPINQDTDEIDIDLTDPDVEKAATKIQAGFKGHKTRKEMKQKAEDTEKGLPSEEKEKIDIDLNDPDVEKAATKIQAGFKGHKTRKEMKEKSTKEGEKTTVEEKGDEIETDLTDTVVEAAATKTQVGLDESKAKEKDGTIDIDLTDPEVEAAATKIQAGFKGHKTRKEMAQSKTTQQKTKEDNDNEGERVASESQQKAQTKQEEEVDIDLEDPEVEAAATKIQAGFKGHKTRKKLQEQKAATEIDDIATDDNKGNEAISTADETIDIDLKDPEVEAAATKIQAGFKGHKTRKEMKEKKELQNVEDPEEDKNYNGEEIDIDLTDPEVEAAATKIQAGFKGHKTRKDMKAKREKDGVEHKDKEQNEVDTEIIKVPITEDTEEKEKDIEDVIDIDLTDPEVEAAATKIQAGFKGHKTRKEMKTKVVKEKEEQLVEKPDEVDIDLNDPEVEAAATKIQAGFKGHKTRKEMKEREHKVDEKKVDETEKEVIDIDLEDPEVEAAATKIQAGFKGHKARKEVKQLQNERDEHASETDKKENEGNSSSAKPINIVLNSQEGGTATDKTTGENESNKDEEIDIDLTDPEVEAAATKIQAGFKGHKARKEVSAMKETESKKENTSISKEVTKEEIDIDLNDPEVEAAATKIQAGFKGHKARKEVAEIKIQKAVVTVEVIPEEVVDIDLNDPEVEAAATKIQAGFKGHKARKEVAEKRLHIEEKKVEETQGQVVESDLNDKVKETPGEVVDIDLNDPEVEAAATKIQAGFKGHKARKEVAEIKLQKQEDMASINMECPEKVEETPDEVVDIDLNDPEVEAAATKIQAGFKGHKARKEVQEIKKVKEEEMSQLHIPTEQSSIDIDLTDPEVEAAATKIQAGFKGHKARKEVNKIKEKKLTDEDAMSKLFTDDEENLKEEVIDIDLEDPEVEAAATKIQAGFKGHKARKEVKEMQNAKKEPVVSESQTNEGNVKEDSPGTDNKDVFRITSSEFSDDGYNSPNWKSKQNTFDKQSTFDSALMTPESSFDLATPVNSIIYQHQDAETSAAQVVFEPVVNSSFEAVLALAAETASAPILADPLSQEVNVMEMSDSTEEDREDPEGVDVNSQIAGMNDAEYAEFVRVSTRAQDAAATTIQSGYRGMRDRRSVANLRRGRRLYTLPEDKEDRAATVLQTGYTSFQFQKQLSERVSENSKEEGKGDVINTKEDTEQVFALNDTTDESTEYHRTTQNMKRKLKFRESSAEYERVGAIPFELHEGYDRSDEPDYENENEEKKEKDDLAAETTEEHHNLALNRECSMVKTKDVDTEVDEKFSQNLFDVSEESDSGDITIVIDDGSPDSLQAVLYLKERNIPHTVEHSGGMFQPALPRLKHRENTVEGGQKIMAYLEQRLPVDVYPMLIPCTSSIKEYQKYIFFSSLLDNMDIVALTLGILNHPELRNNTRESVDLNLVKIRDFLEELIGRDENMAGKRKVHLLFLTLLSGEGSKHVSCLKQSLSTSYNKTEIESLLSDLNKNMVRFEEELQCHVTTLPSEKETWTIEGMFSALDLSLGVFLFHLRRIGLLGQSIADMPALQTFWKQFIKRPTISDVCKIEVVVGDESLSIDDVGSCADYDEYNLSIDPMDEETQKHDREITDPPVETREKKKLRRKKQNEERSWYSLW